MPDPVAGLLTTLRDKRFVDTFRAWYGHVIEDAWSVYASDLDVTEDYQGNWTESLGYAFGNHGCWKGFDAVVKKLSTPHIITSLELLQAFEVYLAKIDADFDEVYGHFLDYVEHRLICRRTSPVFPVCRLTGLPATGTTDETLNPFFFAVGKLFGEAEILGRSVDPVALKDVTKQLGKAAEPESDHQISMGLGNGIEAEPVLEFDRQNVRVGIPKSAPREGTLTIQLSWKCSPEALRVVVNEIPPTLKSAVCSAAILSSGPTPTESGLPFISLPLLRDQLPFIRFCVASLWVASPKGDSLAKRLANAVRLLREADKQAEDSIGLALSITALEALLGRQEQGNSLTDVLATNIAVLTESDRKLRNDAIAFVKMLYNKRSKALHGENIEGDSNIRGQARLLAAGVLRAIWEHRTFTGAEGTDELFKILRERNREDGLPDGVFDSPVRTLWNMGAQIAKHKA